MFVIGLVAVRCGWRCYRYFVQCCCGINIPKCDALLWLPHDLIALKGNRKLGDYLVSVGAELMKTEVEIGMHLCSIAASNENSR